MYQDFRPCFEDTIARWNAFGCGTDTAVQLRTRSGRCAATSQPIAEPQSWPTRCTGRPMVSISAMASSTSSCTL